MKLPEYFFKSLYLDTNLSLVVPSYFWPNEYLNRFAIKELHQWFSVTFLLMYFLMVLRDYDYSYIGYVGLLTSLGLILLILIGRFLSSLSFKHCYFSDFNLNPFSGPIDQGVQMISVLFREILAADIGVPTNDLMVMILKYVTEQEVRGRVVQGWLRSSEVSLGTRTCSTSQLCHLQNHPVSF